MTVIVKCRVLRPKPFNQTGVALLQVLLITSVISLLAIRFTETVREQIAMAEQVELRVIAQLKAVSVQSEVIFMLLSDSVTENKQPAGVLGSDLPEKSVLNRYGLPINWADGVEVEIQDLNGLLPQMFPDHALWRTLLERSSLEQSSINSYLGTWGDMQDSDRRNWNGDGDEPLMSNDGGTYPNGYAQSDKVARWIFDDRPMLLNLVLEVSDIDASYETNLYNAPASLLYAILEHDVTDVLLMERGNEGKRSQGLNEFFRTEFRQENIFVHDSNRLRVTVSVDLPLGSYQQSQTILLKALTNPPFVVIRKH